MITLTMTTATMETMAMVLTREEPELSHGQQPQGLYMDEGARGEPQPGCSCPRSRNRAISGRAFRPNQTEAIVVEDRILNIDTIPDDIT